MHENNFKLVYTNNERETFDNIGFIHTLVYESVEKLGGDEHDYDDCVDLLYKQ